MPRKCYLRHYELITPRLRIMVVQVFGDVHVPFIKAYMEVQMTSL